MDQDTLRSPQSDLYGFGSEQQSSVCHPEGEFQSSEGSEHFYTGAVARIIDNTFLDN